MNILTPFNLNDKEMLEHYLLEDNCTPHFTIEHKLYYNMLRPIMPLKIRQRLQEKYISNKPFKSNFIDEEFINLIKQVNNFEEDWKHLYPDKNMTAIILTHDVDTQLGFNNIPKILELEERLNFKSCWYIVPYKYKIDEGIINLIKENGHEIGIHGYNHDGKLYYSKKIFDKRSYFINEAIKKYNAVGFRSPMVHRNLEWLQRLNIQYDASCFDYDPFQPFPGGTRFIWPFIVGKFVELPYTLPQDHTLFFELKQKNINIWRNKIKWLIDNHGMVLTLTHPDYLSAKKLYMNLYTELLELLKSTENAWYCLPHEMVKWWLRKEAVKSDDKNESNKIMA